MTLLQGAEGLLLVPQTLEHRCDWRVRQGYCYTSGTSAETVIRALGVTLVGSHHCGAMLARLYRCNACVDRT